MGTTSETKPKRYISVGLLAHVDSGKTTLSEGILYLTGQIRKPGRVDHGDAFLDKYALERQRGITIFSKQAVFQLGDSQVTLLDTPGHVDFSAEMERTLQVLDYAVLVVSGADGVQGHTRTLWNLLARYRIPTFIFVNKMDQPGTDKALILKELKKKLDASCVDMEDPEDIATGDERALEEYLEAGEVSIDTISQMIADRQIFPCYFGAALKLQGVQELLDGIGKYVGDNVSANYDQADNRLQNSGDAQQFGARVYKISRDPQGNRLTHMKITSGELKVKSLLKGGQVSEPWEEKADQIRIYSGEKFETVQQAKAGMICAVTGLKHTFPGEGLGIEAGKQAVTPMLEPVLNYQVYFPDQVDAHTMLGYMRQIEEEDPMLRVIWNEELGEIHVQLMGEVQTEILKSLVSERFGVDVTFGTGNIVYKETIKNVVEGVGHYEPLRHYAEVHLILEPGLPGSGLEFSTDCSTDDLDLNWQRLILTHLLEREHRGVLLGAAITDMKITLVAGRAHLKHTEGGDFRQSTYRAVRQGLMQAESVLLEPYYEFRLEVPSEMIGRALTDVQRMYGEFAPPETDGDQSVLTGSAPVACMRDYQKEVVSYTRGRGRLTLVFQGYAPCHNTEEILENAGYDPEADNENPTGSIFCSHGAGYYVPWQEVPEHMHISSKLEEYLRKDKDAGEMHEGADGNGRGVLRNGAAGGSPSKSGRSRDFGAEDRELEDIVLMTMEKSGQRDPIFTGSLSTSLTYKSLSLSVNMSYSLGSKVRLFSLYEPILNGVSAEKNIRKEFVNRWMAPGDELNTNVPVILSPSDPDYFSSLVHFSSVTSSDISHIQQFANSVWDMYDKSDIRVVSGNYLKCSSLSLRYTLNTEWLRKTPFSNVQLSLNSMNLFTVSAKALKGQDPSQAGFAKPNLSVRPSYTFQLNVTF